MKNIIFILLLNALHIVSIQADVIEKDVKDILKYGSSCHYSCLSCIGSEYYQCASCKSNNSTFIYPQSHVDNVTYLSLSNLTIVIGECICNSDKNSYIQYIGEGCVQNKIFESVLEIALNAMIFSNLGLAGLNFLVQLKAFFLIDFIELFQFFGNFAMINHKNILIVPNIQERYLQMNPTFIMNQKNIGFTSMFQEDSNIKYYKTEKINKIKNIPSSQQLQEDSTNQQVKKEDIVSSFEFKQINQLQSNHFKLSKSLKEHGGNLSYFTLSINFQILILISYSIMVIFLLFHFSVLERKFMNKSNNRIYPSQNLKNENIKRNFQQKSILQYENSKYYSCYSYIICLSNGWLYLCLNEQLIYIQVATSIGDIEVKSIIAIAIFIFILIINFGQILYMTRRSYNPLTKQNIIIFDGIKFVDKQLPRNIVTIKFLLKLTETIIFFQFYNHTIIQLSLLIVLTCLHGIIIILLKPFTSNQYIILSVGQQLIKCILIVIHFAIYFCENDQNNNALEKLYILEPALQFCYLFITLFYNLVISFQDLFFYYEKRKQPTLANQNENSPRNQNYVDGKDDSKILQQSVLKGLNQSLYISETNQDQQNASIQYEKERKFIQLEQSQLVQSPSKSLQAYKNQENEALKFGYIRKPGQQTEIKISQLNQNSQQNEIQIDQKNENSSIENNSKSYYNRSHQDIKSRKQEFENVISPYGRQQKNPLEIVQQHLSKNQQYQ